MGGEELIFHQASQQYEEFKRGPQFGPHDASRTLLKSLNTTCLIVVVFPVSVPNKPN